MRLAAFALSALAVLAACAAPPGVPVAAPGERAVPAIRGAYTPAPGGPPTAEATASGAELALVRGVLSDLQRRSFAQNREFCGYLGLDASGRLVPTPISAGDEASCPLPAVPPGLTLVASFHTHSTYSPDYASEWPTVQDVLTDAQTGIDGYISTPGGRLWHVDTDTLTVREVCGRGCLPQDPNYVAAEDGPLRPVMTLRDLLSWERGGRY
jgi:hypothetical protein